MGLQGPRQQASRLAPIAADAILAARYERWSLPLAVITAVPFALFGAIGAIYLRGIENDIFFQVAAVFPATAGRSNARGRACLLRR